MPYFTGVIVETDHDGSPSAYNHDKYCFPFRQLKLPSEVEAICTLVGTLRSVWWQLLTDVSRQLRVLSATCALHQPYWLTSCLLRPIAATNFPLCKLHTK